MTPTEISAAYAALFDRNGMWSAVNLSYFNKRWWAPGDRESPAISDDLAHAACFLACLKACANRGCDVAFPADWGDPKFYETVALIYVNIANPHTITEVMDRVMQLPKVGA